MLNLSLASLSHVAGILACGAALATPGACHRAPSDARAPAPAERDGERLVRHHPGVDVVSMRNGGFLIRILGGLTRGGEPLHVIDGHPMLIDPRRGIDWFKLEDVAQIRVLKDPAETAVYGPRGVHGVIVITTKQSAARRSRT